MVLEETSFEHQLLLSFHSNIFRVAIFETELNFFIFGIVTFDIWFFHRLWLTIFDILNFVIDHDVFGSLETHGVLGLMMVYHVFFFLFYALVSESQFLRLFSSKHSAFEFILKISFFEVIEIYFVFREEKFFSVL